MCIRDDFKNVSVQTYLYLGAEHEQTKKVSIAIASIAKGLNKSITPTISQPHKVDNARCPIACAFGMDRIS